MRDHLPRVAPAIAQRAVTEPPRVFRLQILRATLRGSSLESDHESARDYAGTFVGSAFGPGRAAAALPWARLWHFGGAGDFCAALQVPFVRGHLLSRRIGPMAS